MSLVIAFGACQDRPSSGIASSGLAPDGTARVDWPSFGGGLDGQRYSPLADIDRESIHRLRIAWTWETGEREWRPPDGDFVSTPGWFQATPIVLNDTMYLSTPFNRAVALDATTGIELWSYDPGAYRHPLPPDRGAYVHRGVAFWSSTTHRRIFLNSRWRLIALDARTGRPDPTFGNAGEVDLATGLRWTVNREHVGQTSPPLVLGDLVVVGNSIDDALVHRRDPPGDVQAFDARSGKLAWRWSPVPSSGEPGYDTWEAGTAEVTGHANVWAPMSADSARGLIYLPVSTASNDWYGGERRGANLFAESLVCLDAATGRMVWFAQLVHHGLWDYDPPAQPVLFAIDRGGRSIDAVAVTGKTGFVYAFDRVSGEPLWPLEERPAPASSVPGEAAFPTQPHPERPAPFAKQGFELDDVVDFSPAIRAAALEALRGRKTGELFSPPSMEGTVTLPGWIGGAGWGGGAFDPTTSTLYVKATNRASLAQLVAGGSRGGPRFVLDPSVAPYFEIDLPVRWRDRILALLGFRPVPIPINKPPYGTLTAIDLSTGDHRWQVVLGDYTELRRHPRLRGLDLPPLGVPGAPGPLVTAGGLVFLTGGGDVLFAIDPDDGRTLWEYPLGAPGYSNPMTYRTALGRQYIVLAVGRHDRARLVAFGLAPPSVGEQ